MALADQIFHTVLRIHGAVYEATDGLVGHRTLGVPALMLRTKGRRTGETRTNSLVYARDGDRLLVVPSNGGASRAPGWLHNVRADANVEVQIGRRRNSATATVITNQDPDFARVWKTVNENNGHRYEAYQRRTSRQIPVVALTLDEPA